MMQKCSAASNVMAWGHQIDGGDCSKVQEQMIAGVQSIHSAIFAFAALKADSSVVACGNKLNGGDCMVIGKSARSMCMGSEALS